ncbi:hypothetical protein [Telmatospirillum sp. J64-1]|uniref:hypothetical protein n=1 Tax=Telmatospirillum sp. J64-1 TaxID=2502183 RepID=UPI00115D407B|nr:hypothetical protein [Telmatospirillum sp. J64-1]
MAQPKRCARCSHPSMCREFGCAAEQASNANRSTQPQEEIQRLRAAIELLCRRAMEAQDSEADNGFALYVAIFTGSLIAGWSPSGFKTEE